MSNLEREPEEWRQVREQLKAKDYRRTHAPASLTGDVAAARARLDQEHS